MAAALTYLLKRRDFTRNVMSEDIKALEKEVKKTKRLASEQAMVLHDLIEDSLPDGYDKLMGIAQATYDACKAWDEANQKLKAAGV